MTRFYNSLSRTPTRRLFLLAGPLAGIVFGVVLLVNADAHTSSRVNAHKSQPAMVSRAATFGLADHAAARGKLVLKRIDPRLRHTFAIFRSRPVTTRLRRAHEEGHATQASAAPASAAFQESILPRILEHWLGAAATDQQSFAGDPGYQPPTTASILGQASAQNVETLAVDGTNFAVLAGTKGVCLAVATKTSFGEGGFAAGCASASAVASQGISFSFGSGAGMTRAAGLVPSSNTSVKVDYKSGLTGSVPVISNLYNVVSTSQAPLGDVEYSTPAGAAVTVDGNG